MTRMNVKARFPQRRTPAIIRLLALIPLLAIAPGCGSHPPMPDCTIAIAIGIAPSTASADHLAPAPGNMVSFTGGDVSPAGCLPQPARFRQDLQWSVSDTTDVSIGNTLNVDYGVATCNKATPAPATVMATGTNRLGQTIIGTSSLTCN